MARKLEDVYKNAAAVSVSFSTPDNGKAILLLSSTANAYKLTSKTDDYISDGKTIWHVLKKDNKVVIDNIKPSSKAMNAQALLDFTDNYILSASTGKHQTIELTLTPKQNIKQVFDAVGGISSIMFTLATKGDGVSVKSISALSGNGTIKLDHLQIKSLKKVPGNSFTYIPQKNIQVVDLRE